ncbi:hypothetical protein E2C01_020706 [Portunus trituberculatus]|uniref:Uncharacterized protein n=1 Tax=Portunus trituberculatus TaxID=210409 RepID=A0A5B7E466_PORTR|nr:hypothetical protein [Portunus trituberculatus]
MAALGTARNWFHLTIVQEHSQREALGCVVGCGHVKRDGDVCSEVRGCVTRCEIEWRGVGLSGELWGKTASIKTPRAEPSKSGWRVYESRFRDAEVHAAACLSMGGWSRSHTGTDGHAYGCDISRWEPRDTPPVTAREVQPRATTQATYSSLQDTSLQI